jgi:transcriptional regulator with XRE-family HTH domain
MPAKTPLVAEDAAAKLDALGEQIRAHRKALRVSATSAAQAAGMSRVTWHRIESGEASVTMGAYLSAMAALGLNFGVLPSAPVAVEPNVAGDWIPVRIRLAEYPQLKRLAWQVHGTDELSPAEALGIYDRNWRHIDLQALEPRERHLVDALRRALGEGRPDV